MKIKYYYNSSTREFCGTVEPTGGGFKCTEKAPPKAKLDEESFFFVDDRWVAESLTSQNGNQTEKDNAELQKSHLLALATDKISPLQDAVDLGIATESETSQLKLWKKFRVLVNRVDTSLAPDIEWPEMPGS